MEKKKGKCYEIFYRHVFTPAYPHKEVTGRLKYDIAIPVTKISHVAHNYEASMIEDEFGYNFTPKVKHGKKYDWAAPSIGESFQDDFLSPGDQGSQRYTDDKKYKYIHPQESVLPDGRYSWWGVSTSSKWPDKASTIKNLEEEEGVFFTLPSYLQNPPESRYGNNEFSGDLHKMLSCYQDSRRTAPYEPKPDIYLLQGGTLRYKLEICCVVIVCTGEDKESDALKDYRPLQHNSTPESHHDVPVFTLDGLINAEGKVKDYLGTSEPKFYPRFLSNNESWANLAFAFYFNESCGELKCSRDTISMSAIKHPSDPGFCVKTVQPEEFAKFVCPNERI